MADNPSREQQAVVYVDDGKLRVYDTAYTQLQAEEVLKACIKKVGRRARARIVSASQAMRLAG